MGATQFDTLPTSPNVVQPQRNNTGTCIGGDKDQKPIPCTDAFIVKLDPSGNLAWATYLGGPGNDGAIGAALDPNGNVYIVGTSGPGFPMQQPFVTAGALGAAFIAKINATATRLMFSTYFNSAGSVSPNSIKLDGGGNIYLTGTEQNAVFPAATSNALACPAQGIGAFFAKITSAGDGMLFAGCLGGTTAADSMVLDSFGNIYLAGSPNSSFSVTPGAYQTDWQIAATFVSKISSDGSTLLYSSRFGGGPGRVSLAVDRSGAAYVAGQLFAHDFPIVGAARQTCPGPDALDQRFLVKLSPDGSKALYSSFDDPTVFGVTIDVGPDDALVESYIAQPNIVNGRILKIANLEQASGPLFSPLCVLNGANFKSHWPNYPLLPGISPGEIVTLKGVGLGPGTGTGPVVTTDGRIDSTRGGVQVFFDDLAAPLVFVQDRQINVVAPYALAGKSQTAIRVVYQGQTSLTATLPVSAVSPAAFLDFSTGLPLVFNADFTLNSPARPIPSGGAITMYFTGGGQTAPASFDGEISPGAGGLQADVSAVLTNGSPGSTIPLTILYAGPAPLETSAVQQINVQLPGNLPNGYFTPFNQVYVVLTIGGQIVAARVYSR